MVGFSKNEQLFKNVRTHKVCIECERKREIKFFKTPKTHKCIECQRRRKRVEKSESISVLKKKAWDSFSRFIRVFYSLKTTGTKENCECYTCYQVVPYQNIQAGHGLGGRDSSILFDEGIVRGQCKTCNIFLHGNYDVFHARLIQENGLEWYLQKLEQKKSILQYKAHDYKEIAEKYKLLYEQL